MVKISHEMTGPFMTNCFLVADEKTNEAALIDPGDEAEILCRFVEEAGVEVKYLLATHGHLDHVSAAHDMAEKLGLGFMISAKDEFLIEKISESRMLYGMDPVPQPKVEGYLKGGDTLPLGEGELKIIEAPGHSPGSVLIQVGPRDIVVGDVLFAGSIGRTDLPGGDMNTLRNSIMKVLLPMGDEMRVYPGHGPATTLAREKTANPFILEWTLV